MKKITFHKPIWKSIRSFLLMNVGVLLLSIGVYFFKIPNGFSTGGVSGIGTILGKLTPAITPATWIAIINVVLLLLGFLVLGKETGAKTVYCSLMFSGLTWLFELVLPLPTPITDEPFMELVYAILLTAIGSAMMFYCQASSGGTDIVALILKKYSDLDTGKALLCTDFLIAFSTFFVFDVLTGLFSLMGLFAKAFLVDIVIENLYTCKYFIVITTKKDEISQYIMQNLHHGVTIAEGKGAFTGEDRAMIHTVCKRVEAYRLRRGIRELDPHAFTIVTTSSEIIGRGFRSV